MEERMNRSAIILVVAILAGVTWTAAQQEVLSRPGPGSGVMDVRVINHPAVTAAQSGAWEVGLSRPADARIIGMPNVTVSRPYFIQLNTTYRVTWSAADSEDVTITDAGGGGWVKVKGSRWINLDQARSVEVAR
jgi:hypothetical protein